MDNLISASWGIELASDNTYTGLTGSTVPEWDHFASQNAVCSCCYCNLACAHHSSRWQ